MCLFISVYVFFLFYVRCICFGRFVQVLYSKKDSEGPPSVQVADGEGSVSLLLGALQKYTVYVLQVLAYTRMGDGPPSNRILLRTKEDGRTQISLTLSNHQLFNICFHIFYLVSTNSRVMCPSGIYHLQTITSNHTHITDTQHKQVQIRPRSICIRNKKVQFKANVTATSKEVPLTKSTVFSVL